MRTFELLVLIAYPVVDFKRILMRMVGSYLLESLRGSEFHHGHIRV